MVPLWDNAQVRQTGKAMYMMRTADSVERRRCENQFGRGDSEKVVAHHIVEIMRLMSTSGSRLRSKEASDK